MKRTRRDPPEESDEARRQRCHRMRPSDPSQQAHKAERYAESLEAQHGKRDRRTVEAWDVAADAYEQAGSLNMANHIRLSKIMAVTGKGYGYGISPPHGIFTKGATMAYVKAMVKERGSPYFDRASSRFFGGDTFYGPYVGPGGVFFVQVNRAGTKIKALSPDWNISTKFEADEGDSLGYVRRMAQQLARG